MRHTVLSRAIGSPPLHAGRGTGTVAAIWERPSAFFRSHPWLLPASLLFAWLAMLAFVIPYQTDESVYRIIAKGIVDGRWPYRDMFDHKPPVLHALYFPSAVGATTEFQRIVAAAFVACSFPFVWDLAGRWLGPDERTPAICAYALALANPFLKITSNPEAYLLLPLVAAVASRSSWRAGALLGIAVAIKPVAIVFLPLLLFQWGRRSIGMLVALLAVCAIVALPFAPIWSDFIHANVMFNVDYIGEDSRGWTDLVGVEFSVVLASAGLWILAVVGLGRRPRPELWVWALCAILAIKLSGRDYPHYWVLLAPPSALLAARGWSTVRSWHRPFVVGLAMVWCVAAVVVVSGLVIAVVRRDVHDDLIAAIEATPGELYVAGPSEFYVRSDRMPERRFFYPTPLLVDHHNDQALLRDFSLCPPAAVVLEKPREGTETLSWQSELETIYRRGRDYGSMWLFTEPVKRCEFSR